MLLRYGKQDSVGWKGVLEPMIALSRYYFSSSIRTEANISLQAVKTRVSTKLQVQGNWLLPLIKTLPDISIYLSHTHTSLFSGVPIIRWVNGFQSQIKEAEKFIMLHKEA